MGWMRKFGFFSHQVLLLFAFLGVLFVPFSFRYLTVQSDITTLLFEDLIVFIGEHLDGFYMATSEISSDSSTFYLLFFVLFFLAIALASGLSFFNFWKTHKDLILKAIQLIVAYYLAVVMMKYGFDKIFKVQFYLPEPNTLYTPLGMLDRDILFWSTMGTSRTYNIFLGVMEVVPAIMLLFSRTRLLGLCILSGILVNVVFINFGFDISVKLYSLFLLFLTLLLLVPFFNQLAQFFIFNKSTVLNRLSGKELIASNPLRLALKSVVITLFFVETLFTYIQQQQFNDDAVPRNLLHGAYEVFEVESVNAIDLDIKRVFIHRHNYLILQHNDESFEDYQLEVDATRRQFILTDYDRQTMIWQYSYSEATQILEITSVDLGITIYSKSLSWRELPLLQPLFHWTVDEV